MEHHDEIIVNASDLMWSVRGSAIHNIMENAGSNCIKELRISEKLNGITVSGKLDLLEIGSNDNILWDYKDTSVWTYIYNPNGKKEWVAQTNILMYLLNMHDIAVTGIKIQLFFRDWNQREALVKQSSGYPQRSTIVIDIPEWDPENIELYIIDRLEKHFKAPITHCDESERWAKPNQWAVQKKGAQKAYRVYNDIDSADKFLATLKNSSEYEIEFRQGENTRCEKYCEVNKWCPFWKELQNANT